MYHGIIIDKAFRDASFPKKFKVFAKKKEGTWLIFGIEIENSDLEETVKNIQNEMRANDNWYAHLYNDDELIVVFKDKVFKVTPNASSWNPIIEYGKEKGIADNQLDFWPNRFQDEIHYFNSK